MSEGIGTCIQRAKELFDLIDGNLDFEGIEEKKITPITNLILAGQLDRLNDNLDKFNTTMNNVLTKLNNARFFQTGRDGEGI